MSSKECLVIVARYPEVERLNIKLKRLDIALSYKLVLLFLKDLINAHKGKGYDVAIAFTPKEREDEFNVFFPGTECYPQIGRNLGEGLLNVFEHFLKKYEKVVLIVSDAPNVRASTIIRAFKLLDRKDVVIGPCLDGGYYLGGMKRLEDIFEGIDWGRHDVLEQTIKRIKEKKLKYTKLIAKRDIDKVEDLIELKKSLRRADAPLTYDLLKEIEI